MDKNKLLDMFLTKTIITRRLVYKKVDPNLWMYRAELSEGKNEIYHYLTKIAEFDTFEDILYILDIRFLKHLATTKSTIRDIIRKANQIGVKKIFKVEPKLYFSVYSFITDSGIEVSNSFERRLFKIPVLPHFPKNNYLSPVRPIFSQPQANKPFKRVDRGLYFDDYGLYIKKDKNFWTIYTRNDNLVVRGGIKYLSVAKKLVNELNDFIDFSKFKQRNDGISVDLNNKKLSIKDLTYMKELVNEIRKRKVND